LMKDLNYGQSYKYAHSFDNHFTEQQYLPDALSGTIYYRPTDQGAEKAIHERLNQWWKKKQR
jgi:putative ATPase